MNKDEALKMAIETMEATKLGDIALGVSRSIELDATIQACKEALEQHEILEAISNDVAKQQKDKQFYQSSLVDMVKNQQPAQKPVAWIIQTQKIDGEPTEPYAMMGKYKYVADTCDFGEPIPLYTHPAPSWQGLSDDEIRKECAINFSIKLDKVSQPDIDLCRAIEQALREKNTP
jgi:hypothetical protein